ncbi:MAG: hypothetical protein A3H17_03420 [Candidatus Levybacteria bacterium RIFCSPLOWO2_12_FULL_37_14]|nr:MAG: hypothetical protein US43_C0002G0023 [Candidatus Levybacteria bacterium GW2011_GWA1_37_16]KKQ38409.1 MAG: hypothetical protein US55_C0007G0018 [Candidatus Levybacteria bacterium GW2011_GWC2_37_7]KKQ40954.1 MAG: hypothetical protein US59_C0042G0004 [Candidatus Levybacteria bacterium GW2011_GWB1_37_8]OGH49895.1 MAG: hypothetical protein A3H17_03420 [Candidatus Levybacteria bacterium RIFCSPLOWO2_12_FULL_37_14]
MNTKIYLNNENKWIATDKNYKKVLFSNKNLDKLQEIIKKKNIEDAIIMFVPSFNTTLAPTCL